MTNLEPSKFKKYFYEYAIFSLVSCTIFLFFQFNSLNIYIRSRLTEEKSEMIKVIEKNNSLLNQILNNKNKNYE